MSDETLRIKVEYDVDDSNLTKSLNKIQTNTGKALSSGSGGPQTAIDKSLLQAAKLQDHLKVLQEAQTKLSGQPGMERSLAKVNQELAGVASYYKRTATDSASYLQNLQKEVELRKQATQLVNQANKNEGVYSAHSQRQYQMLQQIAGAAPGGGILSNFLSGARNAAATEGGGGGLFSGAGLAGGGMAAGAAAAAAAIALVASKMNEMASRAEQLAQSASSASSSLGQLRSATERTKINQDANAVSGGVTIAGIKQGLTQFGDSIVGGLFSNPSDKKKAVSDAISGGLGGDAGVQWQRIKEQGQDINIDLARQKQGLEIQQYRQNRDHALDLKQFAIDTENTRFDLQKQAQRQEQDYQIAKTQFDENFQGKMAAKQFAFQKQYAQQDYQLGVQRQTQDYQINQQRAAADLKLSLSDKAYDFNVSRSRATQDYGIQKADTKFDFNRSLSRNQQEFDINKSRNQADYSESLQKAVMGGADGMSLMWMSRDYRKAQQRQLEDFQRQKTIATEDYTTQLGRGDRNFQMGQDRNLADFNLSNQRDVRGFNIAQGRGAEDFNKSLQRGAQDFGIANQRMDTARQMQIETELYTRKWQGIQLELQHNRNLQDSTIALQRFNQATGMQAQRLANQGADIAQDQSLAWRDYNISSYRTLRDYDRTKQDFAGQQRKDNPLGAYGQSLTDPIFADALAKNGKATGQVPLGDQINATLNQNQNIDWGNLIGNALAFWRPPGGFDSGSNTGLKSDVFQKSPVNVNIDAGNNTFNVDPGLSPQLQRFVNDELAKLKLGVENMIQSYYGG
jgi:hypothetical protein